VGLVGRRCLVGGVRPARLGAQVCSSTHGWVETGVGPSAAAVNCS
jgi:hypothetical protein